MFNSSAYWLVLVHDKEETPLLESYGINMLPTFTFFGTRDKNDLSMCKRAMIVPRRLQLPEPSSAKPCSMDETYSQNWCNLITAWDRKLDSVRSKVGSDRLTCRIPGIWVPNSTANALPVCDKMYAESANDTLGLGDLILGPQRITETNDLEALLTRQPIGTHLSSHSCVRRCSSYSYELVEQTYNRYDRRYAHYHLYMYFASPSVETWTQFRIKTPLTLLSSVGGTMGLVLGFSMFSFFSSLADWIDRILAKGR